ncbi:MAG: nitrogen regulation protein NR(I), partial [Alphaproteobacteria bacterium]|nr:nitrogen regulation protein NR(I) [Alphaproteobacteria bacterium]
LQQGEYTTVGGRLPIKANVRIIAATNRDLRHLITQGLFREDLFYRLNVVPLRLPPLRERTSDIADLARHFLERAAAEGLAAKTLSPEAVERLKLYPWPGNVRELENLMRRFAALSPDDVIGADAVDIELAVKPAPGSAEDRPAHDETLADAIDRHLQRYFAEHGDALPPAGLYDRVLRELEKPLIGITLAATRGNQIRAADLLGLNRNTLRKKIRDLDIEVIRGLTGSRRRH